MASDTMIRSLLETDVIACCDLIRENWNDEQIVERTRIELQHAFSSVKYRPFYYVYEYDGRVVGFAGMFPSLMMHNLYDFIWLNVSKEMQGQGIGKQLTLHRISEVKKRGGTMIQLMTKRHGFFTRMKFKTVGVYDEWVLMNMQLGKVVI